MRRLLLSVGPLLALACGGLTTSDLGTSVGTAGGGAGAASSAGASGTGGSAGSISAGAAGSGLAGAAGSGGTADDPCVFGKSRLCLLNGCPQSCKRPDGTYGGGCIPMADEVQGILSDAAYCNPLPEDPTTTWCRGCAQVGACFVFADVIEYPDSRAARCIDEAVCPVLAKAGHPDVCRYTDGTKYDGPLDDPTSCVPTVHARLCAGACGECEAGTHCTYRSKQRPLGVCAPDKLLPCGLTNGAPCDGDRACFVLPQPGVWHHWSVETGRCLPKEECVELGQVLPGGAACFQLSSTGDVTLLSGSLEEL